jgi:hypothetical protein
MKPGMKRSFAEHQQFLHNLEELDQSLIESNLSQKVLITEFSSMLKGDKEDHSKFFSSHLPKLVQD